MHPLLSLLISATAFISWLFIPPPLQAATYYLSPSGADTNPGTQTAPWKTLPPAIARLLAGDILYLRGGTYTHPYLTISHSGTSSAPITIKNFGQEHVVITNSGPLSFENSAWWIIDGLVFEKGLPSEHIRLGKSNGYPPLPMPKTSLFATVKLAIPLSKASKSPMPMTSSSTTAIFIISGEENQEPTGNAMPLSPLIMVTTSPFKITSLRTSAGTGFTGSGSTTFPAPVGIT